MRLSIIVPILNEAELLPKALEKLAFWQQNPECEVIIVDGGSTDGSIDLAYQKGFQVLHSHKGRARQMNKGATASTGDVLLFLHIDTALPDNAGKLIAEQMANPLCLWGRFDVSIDSRHWLLAIVGWFINTRSRLSGIATGDQAIFIRTDTFCYLGGFTEQPLMEDIDISRRLLHLSSPACLKHKVITSARRWQQKGIVRTILLMWRLRYLYWRGTPADKLAREYL